MEDVEEQGVTEPSNDSSTGPGSEAGDAQADSSPSTRQARLERLLPVLQWVGDREVARTVRSLSEAELKEQSLAVRTALHALKKKQNPTAFLNQPQYRSTIPLVADAVSVACQDAVVAALGDAADEPDRAQLLAALDEVWDQYPVSVIALMLAYVSVTDMAAADVCDELLESDERFKIPV
jgi:hypothetical protein